MLKLHSIINHDCGLIVVSKISIYNYDTHEQQFYVYLYDLNLEQVYKTHTTYGHLQNSINDWMCDIEQNTIGNYLLIYGPIYAPGCTSETFISLIHIIKQRNISSIKQANINNKIIYDDKAIIKYEKIYLTTLLLKYILIPLPVELQNEIKIILFNLSHKIILI